MCVELCGNSVISVSEQCEDGNTDDHDGCSSDCMIEDGWTYEHTSSDGVDHTLFTPICGDGMVVSTDVCDD